MVRKVNRTRRSQRRLGKLGGKTPTPYPGLRPFRKDEDWLLFGRREQIVQLLDILASAQFVSTIGPSGCGKSSLIKAGVLPALEKGAAPKAGSRWCTTTMRPLGNPFDNLADALVNAVYPSQAPEHVPHDEYWSSVRSMVGDGRLGLQSFLDTSESEAFPNGHRLLLLIDQFEELFTSVEDHAEVERFVELLVALLKAPIEQLYVIITMRTDYLGYCTRYVGLAEVINKTFYLIPRLTPEELREAIARPAETVGGEVEEGLIQELLASTSRSMKKGEGAESDQLPLIQHVLMWMWLRKQKAQKDVAASDGAETTGLTLCKSDFFHPEVGGLDNALSNHADRVLKDAVDEWEAAHRDTPVDKTANLATQHVENVAAALFRQLVEGHQHRFVRRPTIGANVLEASRRTHDDMRYLQWEDLELVIKCFSHPECSFVEQRLRRNEMLSPKTRLDIGHESLIRRWKKLRDWAEDEAEAGERVRSLVRASEYNRIEKRGLFDRQELASYRRDWARTQVLYAGCAQDSTSSDEYFFERLFAYLKLGVLLEPLGNLLKGLGEKTGKYFEPLSSRLSPWVRRIGLRFVSRERDCQDLPNQSWASRYIDNAVVVEGDHAHDSTARNPESIFEGARAFWERSSRRAYWRRLLWSVGLPASISIMMALFALWILNAAQEAKVNRNWSALGNFMVEGRVLGRAKDQETLRDRLEAVRTAELPAEPLDWGGLPLKPGHNESMRDEYELAYRLFSSYANLHSVAASTKSENNRWGRLYREPYWDRVPLGDVVQFSHEPFGTCVATIDGIGQIAVTCNETDDPMHALEDHLGPPDELPFDPVVFLQGGTKEQKAMVQVALRTASLGFRSLDQRLIAMSPDRKLRSCELKQVPSSASTSDSGAHGSMALDCPIVPLDLDEKQDGRALRAADVDDSGRFLVAVYRDCRLGSGGMDCGFGSPEDERMSAPRIRFFARLIDLSEKPHVVGDFKLESKDGLLCNYPTDTTLIKLGMSSSTAELALTIVFDHPAHLCQWLIPKDSTSNKSAELVRTMSIKEGNRIGLDVSDKGERVLVGVDQFLMEGKLEPEEGRSAPSLRPIMPSTEDLRTLHYLDEGRVVSSTLDALVKVFEIADELRGTKQLLTNRRLVEKLAVDADNKVVFGVAQCRDDESQIGEGGSGQSNSASSAQSASCDGARDVLRWKLEGPGVESPIFGRWDRNGDDSKHSDPFEHIRKEIEGMAQVRTQLKSSSFQDVIADLVDADLPNAGGLQTGHVLEWKKKPRVAIVMTSNGFVAFYALSSGAVDGLAPAQLLFSLTPLYDADLVPQLYALDDSKLFCQSREVESDLVRACRLELAFKLREDRTEAFATLRDELGKLGKEVPEAPTLAYYFPRLLTEPK